MIELFILIGVDQMSDKKDGLPKVYPFVQPTPAQKITSTPPPIHKPNSKISERGLLSVVTLVISLGALTVALLGGSKLILDIFNEGLDSSFDKIWAKAIVLGLAYLFGWMSSAVCIRVYGNLILPAIIKIYTWGCLGGVSFLYIMILSRLFKQKYDLPHYLAYFLVIAAGLAVLVGLHLILEGHNLRPYAIPLLIISMGQLGLIVFRYVFTEDANGWYLWGDLLFLGAMTAFSILMVSHLGILTPFRNRLSIFFDRNSKVIRPES